RPPPDKLSVPVSTSTLPALLNAAPSRNVPLLADLRNVPALLNAVLLDALEPRVSNTSNVAPSRLLTEAPLSRFRLAPQRVTLPALSGGRLSSNRAVSWLVPLMRVCPPPLIAPDPDQLKAPLIVRSPGPRRVPPLSVKAPSMTEAAAS